MLFLTACGGVADGESDAAAGQEGFEYGASQEEVDAVIADLEPVELNLQMPYTSAAIDTTSGPFIEEIEERSGGKITVEPIYAQAIAGFDEIDDALADGRLDLAYAIPGYDPSTYPAFDALQTATVAAPNSSMMGTLAGSAAIMETAWDSDLLLDQYESQGMIPLIPLGMILPSFIFCNAPTSALQDFEGRQIRTGSSAHQSIAEGLGATPTTLEGYEVYEGLQRGVADCTVSGGSNMVQDGLDEVAPHTSYPVESGLSGVIGTWSGGKNFSELPLAYQQIIFDASAMITAGYTGGNIERSVEAVELALEANGTVAAFDEAAEAQALETTQRMLAETIDAGNVEPELVENYVDNVQKWTERLEELGYEDHGTYAEVSESSSYNLTIEDFEAFGKEVFEAAAVNHRPG